jgi:hypothetical protein
MSRSDWLAVLGIVLAVVFGIPTVRFFQQGDRALGALTLIVTLIAFCLSLYIVWESRLPAFTVVACHLRLEVYDQAGKTARLRKTVVIRPNHRGLDHYAHRNISADGTVAFTTDPNVVLVDHKVSAGDHSVYVRFPHQLRPFTPVTTWIEVDCRDTFATAPEGVILLVDSPIKKGSIEITLPVVRPPRGSRAFYRASGKEEELPPPEIMGHQSTWSRSHRLFGLPYGEYEVTWDW